MYKRSKPKHALLFAVVFSTAILGTVHLCTFVWLTAFVYGDNIRGYAPAGITGLAILAMATLLNLVYFQFLATRNNHPAGRYVLGGLLGVPLAVVVTSYYGYILLKIAGYSLSKDIAIHIVGIVLFSAIAVGAHMLFTRKNSDNKFIERDAVPAARPPRPS